MNSVFVVNKKQMFSLRDHQLEEIFSWTVLSFLDYWICLATVQNRRKYTRKVLLISLEAAVRVVVEIGLGSCAVWGPMTDLGDVGQDATMLPGFPDLFGKVFYINFKFSYQKFFARAMKQNNLITFAITRRYYDSFNTLY